MIALESTVVTVKHLVALSGYEPVTDPITHLSFTPTGARVTVVTQKGYQCVSGVHVWGAGPEVPESMPEYGARHYWSEDWSTQPEWVLDILRHLALGQIAGLE